MGTEQVASQEKSKKCKAKKIFEYVLDAFIILVFIIAVFVTIIAINQSKTGVTSIFGKTMYTVQSDSMTGEFDEGALVFGSIYEGEELEIGQVITFRQVVGNEYIINTHRIVNKLAIGDGDFYYQTQGDKEGLGVDSGYRYEKDILSVYESNIGGIGSFVDWLKTTPGFLVCVILPIGASLAYQAYKIIAILLKAREEKLTAVAAEGTSDEVKEAIIKQYLENLKKEEAEAQAKQEVSSEADKGAADGAN